MAWPRAEALTGNTWSQGRGQPFRGRRCSQLPLRAQESAGEPPGPPRNSLGAERLAAAVGCLQGAPVLRSQHRTEGRCAVNGWMGFPKLSLAVLECRTTLEMQQSQGKTPYRARLCRAGPSGVRAGRRGAVRCGGGSLCRARSVRRTRFNTVRWGPPACVPFVTVLSWSPW